MFNEHRARMYIVGKDIIIDESMSAHLVREFRYDDMGHPDLRKIQRKPKGVGTEIKSAADGVTGVMQHLEFQQSAEANKLKKFQCAPDSLPWHVAVTLRCTERWHGTGRTCNGDAGFGSFLCVVELLKRGLFAKFVVKQASKFFLKQVFKSWEATNPRRGEHCVYVTKVDLGGREGTVVALGWMSKVMKTFVGTSGTTLAGPPHVLPRSKVVIDDDGCASTLKYTKSEDQPVFVYELFQAFAKIDSHDHKRQGILALESSWITNNWWHRLFTTIVGMIIVDAYLMYKMEFKALFPGKPHEDLITWGNKLAYQLIHFDKLQARNNPSRAATPPATASAPSRSAARENEVTGCHILQSLRYTPSYQAALAKNDKYMSCRRVCVVCKTQTSAYCSDCSTNVESLVPSFVCVCKSDGPDHGACLRQHIKDVSK